MITSDILLIAMMVCVLGGVFLFVKESTQELD